jgi:RNase P subunit RPR2
METDKRTICRHCSEPVVRGLRARGSGRLEGAARHTACRGGSSMKPTQRRPLRSLVAR